MQNTDYRQGVYALILKDSNLMMVQKKSNGLWDFPGGGVDEGESIEQAIRREISEELGTSKVDLLHVGKTTNKYDWPEKEVEKHYQKTGLLRKGQEQNFDILLFTGNDSEINLQTEELLNFKWVPFSELLPNMSYKDQFEIIQKVLSEKNILL